MTWNFCRYTWNCQLSIKSHFFFNLIIIPSRVSKDTISLGCNFCFSLFASNFCYDCWRSTSENNLWMENQEISTKFRFFCSFQCSMNNHWSNTAKSIKFFERIIIQYFNWIIWRKVLIMLKSKCQWLWSITLRDRTMIWSWIWARKTFEATVRKSLIYQCQSFTRYYRTYTTAWPMDLWCMRLFLWEYSY